MLVLSEADVRAVLPMSDLIAAMHAALAEFSTGRVQQPLRTVLEVGKKSAFFGVMPAYVPDTGALGTKLVTVFGTNAAIGLPTHLATVLLLDSETGAVRALMDGRYITEARTAAVSAVSAQSHARASRPVRERSIEADGCAGARVRKRQNCRVRSRSHCSCHGVEVAGRRE
jgi:ornithine cyclodeaminase/alanine dehydrogenase-like protein (mu-crystallin family)